MVFDDNRFKIGKVPAEGNRNRKGTGAQRSTFGANAVHAEGVERIRAKNAENFSGSLKCKSSAKIRVAFNLCKSAGGSCAPWDMKIKALQDHKHLCVFCLFRDISRNLICFAPLAPQR